MEIKIEDAMVSADVSPSSALNIPRGGKGEKAFFNYKKKQKMFKQKIPKFKDYLKTNKAY